MKSFLFALLCIASVFGSTATAQISPQSQIRWSQPITGQGPISQLYNGIPQADQFTGSPTNDFCGKLKAAEVYAIQNGIGTVDATHFTGTQNCSSDPFHLLGGTAGANVALKVMLPASVINFTLPIQIDDGGMMIAGAGRGNTVWVYTGTNAALSTNNNAAMVLGGDAGTFTQFTDLRDFSVATSSASGYTGYDFIVYNAHRNKLSDMSFWGNQSCFGTEGAVSNTFTKLHCSIEDAVNFGWSSYQNPVSGFYFSSQGSNQTTDSTVADIAAEGIHGVGITCDQCANMVFLAGTSEINYGGVVVNPTSKFNTFIGMDIEGNINPSGNANGVDYLDTGGSNWLINGIYTSSCSGCASVYQGGGVGNDWLEGDNGAFTGAGGLFNILGNNSKLGVAGLGTTSMYIVSAAQLGTTNVLVAPILASNSGTPTFSAGTGVTSVACSSLASAGCSSMRGRLTITNASATTAEVLATVTFASALPSAPICQLSQEGGAAFYGLYVPSASTTSFQIENNNTISGVTSIFVDYYCTR